MSQTAPVSTTPFSHPTTQHLLLNVAAIGAAVVLPTLFPVAMANGTLLGGVADAAGGLGQNLFSGFMQRFFQRRENDPTRPDLNRDLDIRLSEQGQLTNAQLAELRTAKEQQADPKIAALLATLAQDNATLATQFRADFTQLNGELAVHFQRLSEQLQRIETKLDQRNDAVVDKLLARISEEAQEKGRLRAELEAALNRLAEAEAKGNISAGDTLTQLREDGDPKPLGAFLDQQLAATQTDLLALLRERLAVAYISGEIDRARECAHQILATLPNDLFATNELGHIYQLRGDLEAASKQYRRLLELAPDDEGVKATAWGNLGLIFQTQGKLAEAEQFHRDALAINQKLGRLEGQASDLANLGQIAKDRGNLAEARRLWTEARELFARVGMAPQVALMEAWLAGLSE